MRIGYLLNTYPMTSTTFINREIHALERHGVEVKRYAVREWSVPLVDEGDEAERDKTRYILTGNAGGLAGAFALELTTNLFGVMRALGPWASLLRAARGGITRHVAYLLQAAYFRRCAAEDGITHVHAHFGANAAAVAMLARRMGGPSYSFTVHGPDELRENVLQNYPVKLKYAAFVAAISHYCRSQIDWFADGKFSDKIKIVHCGLNLAEFETSPAPAKPSFLCVGRLCRQKGQMSLPAAVSALRAQTPGIRVTLIGEGDIRDELEAEIERLGVGEHFELRGWRSGEEVRAAIREHRFFLLPSAAEGLPVVLMEAYAMGRAAISTYIAGIPELIDDETGWLFAASDQDGLCAAMRAALAIDDKDLAVMAQRGRERVLAAHDVDRETARLVSYFKSEGGAG